MNLGTKNQELEISSYQAGFSGDRSVHSLAKNVYCLLFIAYFASLERTRA